MTSLDDALTTGPDDEELFAGLHRSVAGAAMTTSVADVEALGRRTRRRHRAALAGVGTSAAALVAAVAMLASTTDTGSGTAPVRGVTMATGKRLAPGQTVDIQEAGFSLRSKGDGKVTLSISEVVDADKIQAALASIGISSRVERITVPANWSGPYCKRKEADPQPMSVSDAVADYYRYKDAIVPGVGATAMTINAAYIPAGDVILVDVVTLKSFSDKPFSTWEVYKSDPGPCVAAGKSVKVQ